MSQPVFGHAILSVVFKTTTPVTPGRTDGTAYRLSSYSEPLGFKRRVVQSRLIDAPNLGERKETMMQLYGRPYTKQELLQRVGDMSQLCRVELCELTEGKERGVRVLNFHTGPLSFTAVLERALDISRAEYGGLSIAWTSPVGITAPWFYEAQDLGFLRSFFGGLISTCGMTHILLPEEDTAQHYYYPAKAKEEFPFHGRVSNLPARLVSYGGRWVGQDYILWAEGKVLEACVFGENLCLTRRVETRFGASAFTLHDEVENLGWYDTPHMYLYHINAGFPVVDEGSELVLPSNSVGASDDASLAGLQDWHVCGQPSKNVQEQVYTHELAADPDGNVPAMIVNRNLNGGQGLGLYIKYPKRAFPYFWVWKMMGQGVYSVALEPSTNSLAGRIKEREAGRLKFLKPGEKCEYDLEIGVLSGKKEIGKFEDEVRRLTQDA